MECFKCKIYDGYIPLLICGHFCCAKCYCDLKSAKNPFCLLCNKPLKRGKRKNRLTINIKEK